MRLCAGSTAHKPDVAIRQTERGGLCAADRTRSNARRGYASADGNHARGLGAGCWAGRSVCPWPRRSPRCLWLGYPSRPAAHTSQRCWSAGAPGIGWLLLLLLAGAVPTAVLEVSVWVAAVSPTFGRLFEGTDAASPGQTWPLPTHDPSSTNAIDPRSAAIQMNRAVMAHNCWQPNRKLLASVSDWSDGRQTKQGWQDRRAPGRPPWVVSRTGFASRRR
jgi:hypothetical protein